MTLLYLKVNIFFVVSFAILSLLVVVIYDNKKNVQKMFNVLQNE